MRTYRSSGFVPGFVLGAALGAAGALVVYKKRRRLRAMLWRVKARAEVNRRLENLSRLTKESYEEVVDDVVARYRAAGRIASSELDDFARDLKRRYRDTRGRVRNAIEKEEDEDET